MQENEKPKIKLSFWKLIFLIFFCYSFIGSFVTLYLQPVPKLGLEDGKFMPCPTSPNCVSSQEEKFNFKPINLQNFKCSDVAFVREKLLKLIQENSEYKLQEIDLEGNYLHFTENSNLFNFIDDIEIWFDQDNQLIHFRSASRLGYYDLGVNKRRLEKIKTELNSKLPFC